MGTMYTCGKQVGGQKSMTEPQGLVKRLLPEQSAPESAPANES
jgi:hypothetical protein